MGNNAASAASVGRSPSRSPEESPVKKSLAVLALVGLFALGSFTAASLGQAPKKPADPAKEDPAPAGKGSVVLKPDAKGRFRISVKDANGKTVLMTAGNGYATEEEAKEAIENVKKILATAKVTVEKAGK